LDPAKTTRDENEPRERARANWRRLREFATFLGLHGSPDERLLSVIARTAPGAPLQALQRARLGHRQGAGTMRLRNAQYLVGPFLGVTYPNKDTAERVRPCPNAVAAQVRQDIACLPDDALFALADDWVDYLRCKRKTPPQRPSGGRSGGGLERTLHVCVFDAGCSGPRAWELVSPHAARCDGTLTPK
jgi:hypothetical protein